MERGGHIKWILVPQWYDNLLMSTDSQCKITGNHIYGSKSINSTIIGILQSCGAFIAVSHLAVDRNVLCGLKLSHKKCTLNNEWWLNSGIILKHKNNFIF